MTRLVNRHFLLGLLAGLVSASVVLTAVIFFIFEDPISSISTSREVRDTEYESHLTSSLGSAQRRASSDFNSLDDLNKVKDRFAKIGVLHSFMLNLDIEGLNDLFSQSEGMSNRGLRDDVQALIVQKIASLDPVGALEKINLYPDVRRRALTRIVFLEWATSELDEAVQYAQELDRLDKQEALMGILKSRDDFSNERRRSLARTLGGEQIAIDMIARRQSGDFISNPEESWRRVVAQLGTVDRESSSALRTLAIHVASTWIEQEGIDVLFAIDETVANQLDRRFIVGSLLEKLSQGDGSKAFELALDIASDDPTIVYHAMRRWASSDPRAAFAAASIVPSPTLRRGSQRVAIFEWVDANPTGFLESLDSLDHASEDLRTLGQERALIALADTSAQEAMGYLEEVDNPRSKRNIARAIVANWVTIDSSDVLAWVRSEPQLEGMRSDLYVVAVRNLARESPQHAFDLARNHSVNGLEAEVIDEVARVDIEDAISMLSNVRSEETLKDSYQAIGTRLLAQGKPDRVLGLIRQHPKAFQSQVLTGLAYPWAFNEPVDLFNRLEDLPSDDVRRTVATALRAANALSKVLSDEQIASLEQFDPDVEVKQTNEVPLEDLLSD